jgi:hypothetical protein
MSVDFEQQGPIAVIKINRPEARNAVNGDVARGIEEAIDQLEADDSIWVGILTGEPPVFCAGADLKEINAGNAAALATAKGGFAGFVQRERTKPPPRVASPGSSSVSGPSRSSRPWTDRRSPAARRSCWRPTSWWRPPRPPSASPR